MVEITIQKVQKPGKRWIHNSMKNPIFTATVKYIARRALTNYKLASRKRAKVED